MDPKERLESRGSSPAEERGVGDEPAGDERRAAGKAATPGAASWRGVRRTARTVAPDAARVASK